MTSWSVHLTPEQAVQVRALAGTLCCVFGHSTFSYSTLSVSLSTQVYKWVLANLMLGDIPAMD